MTPHLHTGDRDDATEAAQVIARIAPSLPQDALEDLKRRLELDIALPSRATVREAHIGLLTELITLHEGPGLPSDADYETLRASRAAAGETWPTSRTLRNAYGHWFKVLQAAANQVCGYNDAGGRIKVPASNAHARNHHPGYTRQDVLDALRLVRQSIGDWPTEWEYETFMRAYRLAAKRAGNPAPRIPGLKQVRTNFGDFPRAVQVARTCWEGNLTD